MQQLFSLLFVCIINVMGEIRNDLTAWQTVNFISELVGGDYIFTPYSRWSAL